MVDKGKKNLTLLMMLALSTNDYKNFKEVYKDIEGISPEMEETLDFLFLGVQVNPPNSPCITCNGDCISPIYDRALGGPYCSGSCQEEAGLKAKLEKEKYLKDKNE